jgi:hypothetical protein
MKSFIAPMIEATITSESSVNFYQTARHNIPEDIHLQELEKERPLG